MYKALLISANRIACTTVNCSGGSIENSNWILQPNTTYTRLDGTVIGVTNSSGIFDLPLTNSFSSSFGVAWTGFDNASPWTLNTDQNCTNWSTTGGAPPASGASLLDDGSSFNAAFAFGKNCNENLNFICVEQ